MFGLSKTISRIAIAVIAVLLVVAFLYLQSCADQRRQAAQSKVDRGQAGAAKQSGTDAVDTVSNVAANQAAGAAIGRQNEEEIRNAKGADQRVDPDANAAGLRALCRRASHRNDPACRVFNPNP